MRNVGSTFNRRGQVFAEYAMIVASVTVVIAGVAVYTQRSLKAKIEKARLYAVSEMGGGVGQYEPYYIRNTSNVQDSSGKHLDIGTSSYGVSTGASTVTDFGNTTCAENGQCDP